MIFELPPAPHHFTPEHEAFRTSVREFVRREIEPHAAAWDEAGSFPRELYRKAAALGLLGIGYPEEYGGTPADTMFAVIAAEEIARAGSGGVQASLGSLHIGLPPVLALGSAELKARVVPPVLRGEKIAALAVVDGEKTFITSGMRADFITVAVRTDPAGRGAGGISLLLVEGATPGLERTELRKTGWWASDTAHLRFSGCRVPAAHLLGEEGQGFKAILRNFNHERLVMAASAVGYAMACTEEALGWARERRTFGRALVEHQVNRHKLVDMVRHAEAARAVVHDLAWRLLHEAGDEAALVARTCLAKIQATQAMEFCTKEAVQILGGMGYMRGSKSERLYREVKVMVIGGGSEEVMKDLAARQLGL